jgi:hypothetical protein
MQPQPGLRLKLKLPTTAATATDESTPTDNAAGDINTATATPTRATGLKVKLNIKVPSTPSQNDHAQQQQRGQEPFPTLPIASSSSSPSNATPKIKLNLKKRIADDTPSSPAQNQTSDGEGYAGRSSAKRSKSKINREDSTAIRSAEKEMINTPVTPKIKFLTRSEPLSTPAPSSTSSPSTSIAPTNLPSTPTPRIRLKTPSSKARPQARARVKSKLRERLDLVANGTSLKDEGQDSRGAGEVDANADGMRGPDGQADTQVEPVPPPKESTQEDRDIVDLEGEVDADADGDGDMDVDMDPEGDMDQDQDDQDEGDQESDLNTPSTPNGHSDLHSNPNSNPNSTPKTLTRKGFSRKPFAFRKKPLPHLLRLIIGNLRRKDAYGLFFDPVDLKEYPDYLQVIGGEDRAMDLGTMESKAEGGEYRRMEDFEVSRVVLDLKRKGIRTNGRD